MPRLSWGNPGERLYEAGVDRGVLYVDGVGVPWNGLISVSENPSGGETKSYYLDGVQYLNASRREEFKATLTAFYSPQEFLACEGITSIRPGLNVSRQRRKTFGLSYRTLVGNDLLGTSLGYKIHLIYNATADPSTKALQTTSNNTDLNPLEWSITTLPRAFTGARHTAHIYIDSRITPPGLMRAIEDVLYGSSLAAARLIEPSELLAMFDNPGSVSRTNYNTLYITVQNSSGINIIDGGLQNTNNFTVIDAGNPSSTGSTGSFYVDGGTPSSTADPSGLNDFYLFSEPATHIFSAGEIVTVSATVLIPEGINYKVYLHAVTGDYYYPSGDTQTYVSTGIPTRVFRTETLTRTESDIQIAVIADTSADPQSVYYMIDVLIEKSSELLPYFDGDTPDANGYTYDWLGTPNASESIARTWA